MPAARHGPPRPCPSAGRSGDQCICRLGTARRGRLRSRNDHRGGMMPDRGQAKARRRVQAEEAGLVRFPGAHERGRHQRGQRAALRRACARRGEHGRDLRGHAVAGLSPAGGAGQRREGADREAEAADRDRLPLRRDPHRGRLRGRRLQLRQAGGRPGPVRPCQGDRPRAHRRGSQRHPADLEQAGLGGCVGGTQRARHAGGRGRRHRAVGPEGQAGRAAAGQAARGAP